MKLRLHEERAEGVRGSGSHRMKVEPQKVWVYHQVWVKQCHRSHEGRDYLKPEQK